MNRVELEGGLVRDPQITWLESGLCMVEFGLLLNGTRYDKSAGQQIVTTTMVTCMMWGKEAQEFGDAVHKGDRVYVLGELDRRKVEKDGKKEEKMRVIVLWWRGTRIRQGGQSEAAPSFDGEPPF